MVRADLQVCTPSHDHLRPVCLTERFISYEMRYAATPWPGQSHAQHWIGNWDWENATQNETLQVAAYRFSSPATSLPAA